MRETNREYPRYPLVGVGGILIQDNKILLVKRKNEPGKGLWAIPGGLVEPGEAIKDAVKREIREETNLVVDALRPINADEVIVRDKEERIKYHYVLVDFLCKVIEGSLKPGDDAKEVRWIDIKRAKELNLTDSTRKLLDKIMEGFFLVIRNRDVKKVLMGVPRDHEHMRVVFELIDGSIIVFHEATMENVSRGVVEVEMHPTRKAISLVGIELDEREKGYSRYQLIEEDKGESEIVEELTNLLRMESEEKS